MENLIKNYLKYRGLRILVRDSNDFKEEEHKRDENGRFAKMNGEKTDSTVYAMASPQISNENVVNAANSVIAGIDKEKLKSSAGRKLTTLPDFLDKQTRVVGTKITDSDSLEELIEKFIEQKASAMSDSRNKLVNLINELNLTESICKNLNIKYEPKKDSIMAKAEQKNNIDLSKYEKQKIEFPPDMIEMFEDKEITKPDEIYTIGNADGDKTGSSVYATGDCINVGQNIIKHLDSFNERKGKMASLYGLSDIPQSIKVIPMNKTTAACVSSMDNGVIYIDGEAVENVEGINLENALLHEYQHNLMTAFIEKNKVSEVGVVLHEMASMVMASALDGESGFEIKNLHEEEHKFNSFESVAKCAHVYHFGQNFGTWFYEKFGHDGFMDLIKNSKHWNIVNTINDFCKRKGVTNGWDGLLDAWITDKYPTFAKDTERATRFKNSLNKLFKIGDDK